ncbi:MAG: hypothetical protein OEY28_03965 [Nitrospira sp.]|nr:hypothetical protein [Nitrospira sp.]
MNNRAGFPWRVMVGALVVAVGLHGAFLPRLGHTEELKACALWRNHGDLTFPVEKVEYNWTCRLQEVIDGSIVSNRVGPIQVALSESLYRYLLDHPPLAAGLITRLDLGLYQSESRGPNRFWGDDGEGTKGIVQLVYQDATSRIYYLEGSHDSRFLPHLTGTAVVFLRMSARKDAGGAESMDSTIVSYTNLDNRFFSGVASLLQPLVQGIVDGKLRKAMGTVNRLGMVMRQHPQRVLSEATAPPAFTDGDVAFLQAAIGEQRNAGDAGRRDMPLP